MTVRDKTGLKTQITDLIDSGGIPKVTAANLRSVLTDLVDSLEEQFSQTWDIVVTWNDSTTVLTDADVAAGAAFSTPEITIPTPDASVGTASPIWVGVPATAPDILAGDRVGQSGQFVIRNSDTAAIVTPYNGVAYKWWRTNSITVSSNAGRIYEIRYRRT